MFIPSLSYWFSWDALNVFMPALIWGVISVYGLKDKLWPQKWLLFSGLMIIGIGISLIAWFRASVGAYDQEADSIKLNSIPKECVGNFLESMKPSMVVVNGSEKEDYTEGVYTYSAKFDLKAPARIPSSIAFKIKSSDLVSIRVWPDGGGTFFTPMKQIDEGDYHYGGILKPMDKYYMLEVKTKSPMTEVIEPQIYVQ